MTTPYNTYTHKKLCRPDVVLLVDDSPIQLQLNTAACNQINVFKKIISFNNGVKALEYLIENISSPVELPQLILSDINMPEMDGFWFVDQCCRLPIHFLNQCHIAMLSSTTDMDDKEKVAAHPKITELLSKPLFPETLSYFIKKHYNM